MARVLIVEDDTLVRNSVQRILARAGHEVWESAGARTALKLMTVVPIDLVITDVYMPGMNGLELIEHLGARQTQRVIAMTGGGVSRSGGDLLADARRLGAEAVIAKPFGPSELTDVVDGVLARAAA